ncbi:LexA family protein [Pseudoalteromonas sp. 1181_04]|uniref:LexA family protein n=1 Tax=Pseudoalteromonas sp. 1181_04 TaxID=2604450 RepID=UPI0040637B41
MNKENLNQRIKRLRKLNGYTQKELAKYVGVSHGSISQWESEITSPKGAQIQPLAKALKVDVMELLQGTGFASNIEAGPEITGTVPLISWVQAGAWKEIEEVNFVSESVSRYRTTAKVGPNAFAVRVVGDSMTSTSGGRSIPAGSVVIADPDIEPQSGRVVIARLDDSNEATVKELVIDAGRSYLRPFNQTFPTIAINGNCSIIGVVKQVIQDF